MSRVSSLIGHDEWDEIGKEPCRSVDDLLDLSVPEYTVFLERLSLGISYTVG